MKAKYIVGMVVLAGLVLGGAIVLRATLVPHPNINGSARGTSSVGVLSTAQPGSASGSLVLASTTHTIGAVTASPNIIAVNTSTNVTVSAVITDPAVIPASVNLLRLGATGTQPTIVGQMQGNGNGTYSIQVPLDPTAPGQINFEVSAAFRGQLTRVISNVISVAIWKTSTDSSTGLTIYTPDFGNSAQVTANTDTPGQALVSYSVQDTSGDFIREFAITIYDNPDQLGLQQWFEQNIDVNGILASNETFHQETLIDGSIALVDVGPLPPAYLDVGSPIEFAFKLTSSGKIISIIRSHANDLTARGYSQQQISALELQILGMAHL